MMSIDKNMVPGSVIISYSSVSSLSDSSNSSDSLDSSDVIGESDESVTVVEAVDVTVLYRLVQLWHSQEGPHIKKNI